MLGKNSHFPPLNDSNSFGTVDYDAQINSKIGNPSNYVLKPMSIQELKTLHHICELERTQLLSILAMAVQNPQLAGYIFYGKLW